MSRNILLCDDESHILRAAEIKLSRGGFNVRCATNGLQAWQMIQDSCPDLLITDCQMPLLDGFGLVARARTHEHTRDLPIVMLTAKGFEISEQIMREEWNVYRVLPKPFSPRALLQLATEILSEVSIAV